MEDLAAKEE
jgi:hypothetical protein